MNGAGDTIESHRASGIRAQSACHSYFEVPEGRTDLQDQLNTNEGIGIIEVIMTMLSA
jgi:hypothetical protein